MKMKNSLIAIAGGAASIAMVAPAIAGDVTVYGRVQVELASVSQQAEAGACSTSEPGSVTVGAGCDGLVHIDNSMGRVGFKASEDLGNGWTGLAKYEFKTDTSDNDTGNKISLTGRESLVGLKGKAVTIELGNLKQAYKYMGGVKYDAFVATTLEARGSGSSSNGGMSHGPLGHSSFHKNSLGVSGGSGPIKFRLTYGAGEGDGSMTAGAMYKQGAMEAFVALADAGDSADTNADPGGEYSATKVGGAYKMGPTKFMLQYEMTDNGGNEPTYTFLGVQHKMGKNTFVLQIGSLDSDDGGYDTSMTTVGVIHKFTKMTRLFAGFRSSDADDDSQEDVVSIGLRKDF